MPFVLPDLRLRDRSRNWCWWVCCLLLLATAINYMDRLTLNLLARTINTDLGLSKSDYASIESGFALAFAFGAILFGFLVDRWNVFWVYPLAVLAWSAAGFFTGFANSFAMLLLCRVLLGAAESANWPCALRTTQRILPPGDRAMGNSLLQSGASVGAILIPLVMFLLFDENRISTWRTPFLVVGACGACWVVFWWLSVRPADLVLAHHSPAAAASAPPAPAPLPRALFVRRFAVLVVLVITINMTWHFLRAWGPLYLQEEHGFTQTQTNWFSFAYYVSTDLGALTAGFIALRLARGGMAVHTSRRLIFLACALLTTLCVLVPVLRGGWVLLAAFLLIGFGSLGVFPLYYSFSQDLTVRHQGKLTGVLGCCCWTAMAAWQFAIGQVVTLTGSLTPAFFIAGLAPLFGFVVLSLLWGPTEELVKPAWPPVSTPAHKPDETRIRASDDGVAPVVAAIEAER
jgi:ACS family hexuronate transporter-like MFS transporter